MAWTDAAAAAGSNPALVNDLDLEVTEVATGNVFKGNVFVNGFSATGGSFDDRNNVECVYVEHPAGVYEVRVIAASITASARPDIVTPWQDFALVVDNADVPDTGPVSVVPVIDRSGSMVAYGYVGTTRTASKQFVGLLGIDDELGRRELRRRRDGRVPGGRPALHTVTGQPDRRGRTRRSTRSGSAAARSWATASSRAATCSRARRQPARPRAVLRRLRQPRLRRGQPGQAVGAGRGGDAAGRRSRCTPVRWARRPTRRCCPASPRNGGRYFYMPTIDDLFEIYNYIRGQVSGDAISVIASAQASTSQVPVMVDALAETATITVAWSDPTFRYVARGARKEGEVDIRLRDPSGRLLHPSASQVHRVVGGGYVVFKLHDPAPGLWHVRVSTASKRHLRYTVGGFCDSPLRLDVKISPKLAAGKPLAISATVRSGKTADRRADDGNGPRPVGLAGGRAARQPRRAREAQAAARPRRRRAAAEHRADGDAAPRARQGRQAGPVRDEELHASRCAGRPPTAAPR